MLLSEESDPLEDLPRPRGGLLEPRPKVGVLTLELRHCRARNGCTVARAFEFLHPRFSDECALPEARELVAQVADELLELAERGSGFKLKFVVGHSVRSPVFATACPADPLLPCHVECG